ncbi:MAG: hypothetical protein ACYCW6_31090 [Candidatus Xenobia bacterium]
MQLWRVAYGPDVAAARTLLMPLARSGDAEGQVAWALLLLRTGQKAQARQVLQNVRGEVSAEACRAAAEALLAADAPGDALRWASDAALLATCWSLLGDPAKAREHLEQLPPTPEVRKRLGFTFESERRWAEARQHYEAAGAFWDAGECAMRMGDLEDARRLFKAQTSPGFGRGMAALRLAQIGRTAPAPPPGRLHPYGGRQDVSDTVVLPVLYGDVPDMQQTLEGLAAFHRRTFGRTLTVRPPVRRHGDLAYDTLERWVRLGLQDALHDALDLEEPEVGEVLLLIWAGEDGGQAEGYGGERHALVRWVPGDAVWEALVAHEFYHGLLGLPHADGHDDVLDRMSLMGQPGCWSPLAWAYLPERVVQSCVASRGALRMVGRANRLEREGDDDAAGVAWQKAAARAPHFLTARLGLAQSLLMRGRYSETERELREIDACWPSEGSHLRLAAYLLQRGHGPQARRMFDEIKGRNGLAVLATLLFAEGHVRSALRVWRRLEDTLLHDLALANQGGCWRELGRFDRAAACFEQTLSRCPDWDSVHAHYAWLLAQAGQPRAAHRELARAHGADDAAAAWVAFHGGDVSTAQHRAERAWKRHPLAQKHAVDVAFFSTVLGTDATRAWEQTRRLSPLSLAGRMAAACLTDPSRLSALYRRTPTPPFALRWLATSRTSNR